MLIPREHSLCRLSECNTSKYASRQLAWLGGIQSYLYGIMLRNSCVFQLPYRRTWQRRLDQMVNYSFEKKKKLCAPNSCCAEAIFVMSSSLLSSWCYFACFLMICFCSKKQLLVAERAERMHPFTQMSNNIFFKMTSEIICKAIYWNLYHPDSCTLHDTSKQ